MGSDLLDRLELNHELTADEQIESRLAYTFALVGDAGDNLARERYVPQRELRSERFFVD